MQENHWVDVVPKQVFYIGKIIVGAADKTRSEYTNPDIR